MRVSFKLIMLIYAVFLCFPLEAGEGVNQLPTGDQQFLNISCAQKIVWASPLQAQGTPVHNYIAPKPTSQTAAQSDRSYKNVALSGTLSSFAVEDRPSGAVRIWSTSGRLVDSIPMALENLKSFSIGKEGLPLYLFVKKDGQAEIAFRKNMKTKLQVLSLADLDEIEGAVFSPDAGLVALSQGDAGLSIYKIKPHVDVVLESISNQSVIVGDKEVPLVIDWEHQNLELGLQRIAHIAKYDSKRAVFSPSGQNLVSFGKDRITIYGQQESEFSESQFIEIADQPLLVPESDISAAAIGNLSSLVVYGTNAGLLFFGARSGSMAETSVLNLGDQKIVHIHVRDDVGIVSVIDDAGTTYTIFAGKEDEGLSPQVILKNTLNTPRLNAPIVGERRGLL